MSEQLQETPEDFAARLQFFEHVCAQLMDVRELKKRYIDEFAAEGYVPKWKQPVGSRNREMGRMDAIPTAVRFAPDIGPVEAERIWKLLPSGWFTIPVAATAVGFDKKEMRRCLFWMARRRLVKYDCSVAAFMRREGDEKGSFKMHDLFTTDGVKHVSRGGDRKSKGVREKYLDLR